MAILFMGNEETDFDSLLSGITFTTDSNYYRTGYQRCAIFWPNSTFDGRGVGFNFSANASSVWVTWRQRANIGFRGGWGNDHMCLYDGATKRVGIVGIGSLNCSIVKFDNSGNRIYLANSTSNMPNDTLTRYDWFINLGPSGSSQLYQNQTLIASYTGNTTFGGSTTLSAGTLTNINQNPDYNSGGGEIIVADEDTRTMNLVILYPTANGTTQQWSGGFNSINEALVDNNAVISTTGTDQVSSFITSDLPSGINTQIRAVKVVASVARGTSGPQNIQLGMRTGNDDGSGMGYGFSSNVAVSNSFSRAQATFDLNPVNSNSWTINMINGLELAVKTK